MKYFFRKVQLFKVTMNDKIATGYGQDGRLYRIERKELIEENDYPELKGKCKEYIEKGLCLGCERLAYPDFTGDDSCYVIIEREQLEANYGKWRIR